MADGTVDICTVQVAADGHGLHWTRAASDRRYRVRIEDGGWHGTHARGEVAWLDLHTGRTLRTTHPLVRREHDGERMAPPREGDACSDQVAALRDRPPPQGGW